MDFLTALWMPIVVSAAFVWIASAITHMVIPFHKSDFGKLPDEDKVMSSLEGVPLGSYMFPYCTQSEMNSPEHKAKREKGPVGTLTVMPNVNMGQNLILTLLLYLLIGVFIAYAGYHSGLEGAPYLEKFRLAGTVAFCAHTFGWLSFAIWYRNIKVWSNLFDGIVYALITAGTFGWLWH